MKQNWMIDFRIQFFIENYQFPPFRRDRISTGGGKIVYVRQGLTSKMLKNFESKTIETIFTELTISKNKWYILFACRSPNVEKTLSLSRYQVV